ncbi:MAG: hypothetical protein IIC24_04530 [Chloroflexi bacterium]|nr:hypothetical protein [Chloroflexota bacterium]
MAQRSILEMVEGRSGEKRIIAVDVAERLRVGQDRLTRMWLRLRDLEDWTEKQEFNFWLNYEKWDRLERQARESGQIEGCPIGPKGCHEDAPIRCDHCAGEKAVHTSDMPGDGSQGQAVRIMICDRGRKPRLVDGQVDPENGQAAMFSLAGRSH